MKSFFQIVKPVTFLILYLVFVSSVQTPAFDCNFPSISDSDFTSLNSLIFEAASETSSFLEDTEDSDKEFLIFSDKTDDEKSFPVKIKTTTRPCIQNDKVIFLIHYTDLPPPVLPEKFWV